MTHKAFVSSTFADLKDHRSHVIEASSKAGIFVDPMERWTAASDEPKKLSLERMKDCDLCVLLVAFRRGHVPKGSLLSITQLEYQAAVKSGIDVLVFMLDEDSPWPRKFDELDRDPEVSRWRHELTETWVVSFFNHDPASIDIAPALTRWVGKALVRPARPGDVILGTWEHECSIARSGFIYMSRFEVTRSGDSYVMSVLDQRDDDEIDPGIGVFDVTSNGDVWTFKAKWGRGRVGSVEAHRINDDLFEGHSTLRGDVVQDDRFVRVGLASGSKR